MSRSSSASPNAADALAPVVIRAATAHDLAALVALREAAFAPYIAPIGQRPAPMDEDLLPFVDDGLLVAQRGDACVGYAAFALRGGSVALSTVAVAPHAQGNGIGRALVNAVERAGQASGKARVCLYTNEAMARSAALYAQLGYREVRRAQADGFNRVYFEKALPPAIVTKGSVDGLFGRRRTQAHRGDRGYGAYALDLSQPLAPPKALFAVPVDSVQMEVGFGSGDHLIHEARRAPNIGYIGAEPFETGMMKAVRVAKADNLQNLRLYMGDARDVIDALPNAALARIDVLFPDPWPKQRHWKRRFISMSGLTRLARVLPEGGTVRFASDIASYVSWTRAHVAAHPSFLLAGDGAAPWEGWPGTRYEAKALREGRPPRYLTLLRVGTHAPDMQR